MYNDSGLSTRFICSLVEVVRHYHPHIKLEGNSEHLADKYYILEVIEKLGAKEADFMFAKTADLVRWKNERDKIETKIRVITDNWKP